MFKVGDSVECIKGIGSPSLETGKQSKVTNLSTCGNFIRIDYEKQYWLKSRFKIRRRRNGSNH